MISGRFARSKRTTQQQQKQNNEKLWKEFEINYVFKRTFCNISRSHAHCRNQCEGQRNWCGLLVAFIAPKVGGIFIELNVAFVVAINWWIISTPARTALAKHLITKTSRPAINSVCLCLASGQWICLTAWLPHWLPACPPKKKTKRTTTTKRSTSRRRGENSTICHFVGPPLFVLFWAKKCALQKVARSSLSLCWWCWVLALHKYVFIYKL